MIQKIKKLSVWAIITIMLGGAQTDGFFMGKIGNLSDDNYIIPLLYIENIEYYNHTQSSAYKEQMVEKLSLTPEVIVTEDKKNADFYLKPKLLKSKIDYISPEHSKYTISVVVELRNKADVLVESEQKNQYIIIDNSQNAQQIAQKMLKKLLEKALEDIIIKIKNKKITG